MQQKEQTGELYFRDHGLERTANILLCMREIFQHADFPIAM